MKPIYTAQEYAIRAVDLIDTRIRRAGRDRILRRPAQTLPARGNLPAALLLSFAAVVIPCIFGRLATPSGGAMPHEDHFDTHLVHAGEPKPRIGGSASAPIFLSTVYEYRGATSYHDLLYPRLNNLPNQRLVAEKVAALEGAQAAVATASGMAAISTTLLTVLGSGGHLLAQGGVYGGTHGFLTDDLPDLGATVDFIDADAPDAWKAKLRPETRAIYVEAMSNPLLEIADHEAVVRFAREHGLVSIIDNTFASPVNFRPLTRGYDLVVHSATKYLNGHSDVVGGVVAGSGERVDRIWRRLNHLGGCLEPFASYLLSRGMKTLGLRVRRQNESALEVARFLEEHPAVNRVNYPGLPSHPRHQRARELFDGFGGMLSFEVAGGATAAERFLEGVRLAIHAPSLGGVETLVIRPAVTSHRGLTPQERQGLGISDALVRLSVGIEAPQDLIADLDQALRQGS